MGSFSEDFEGLTIGQLRKLTEDYSKMQDIIKKQEETIKKLKIKYPTKNVDDNDFNMDKFLKEECGID